MRMIYIMTAHNYKRQGEYELSEMQRALEDITANGYDAIDIKFDFNGDICIVIADTMNE